MKFTIKSVNENIVNLTRKIGYRILNANNQEEHSAARPVLGSGFPRFHIHIKKNEKTGDFNINLHLDQKRPSYRGAPAHSGEYEGKLIKEEAERIKKLSVRVKIIGLEPR